ncbi:MAG TPA: hypothetical protein VMU88_11145, partial [bacterium]|nr:hypothetical protein [bacterium]
MKKFPILALSLTVLGAQAAWAERGDRGHEGHEGGQHEASAHGASHPQTHAPAARGNAPKAHGPASNHSTLIRDNHPADHGRPNPHPMANDHRAPSPAGNHLVSTDRPRPEAYNPKRFSTVRSSSVAVPGRFKTLGVHSAPRPLADRSYYVATSREHSRIELPTRGPDGHALKFHVAARTEIGSPLVQRHMAALGAGPEMGRINHYNAVETRPNYYYWHSYNGYRYCHYYDNWGYHWYGWYLGDTCFWTRYYWGNWWWYDGAAARWCYWHDGGWWWNDPYNTSTVYIYVNGDYQPVQTDGVSGSVEGSVGGGGDVSQASDA